MLAPVKPGEEASLVMVPLSAPSAPAYDSVFTLCCIAHFCLMLNISMFFRYADFVRFIGGSEWDLGWIAGVGVLGAIGMRTAQGMAMSRFGVGAVWVASLVLLIAASLEHLFITTAHSPLVYFMRAFVASGIAGSFGSMVAFISMRAPEERVPELVGMAGSSGFLGWFIGPILGDMLFAGGAVTAVRIERMFLLAAGFAGLSLIFALLAQWRARMRPGAHPHDDDHAGDAYPPELRGAFWRVIARYHPPALVMLALAMGIGIGVPGVFVRAFTAEIGVSNITFFFFTYAVAAFTFRVLTRRFVQRYGMRWVGVAGTLIMGCGMAAFLLVGSETALILPGFLFGLAHALLFPAIVGGGSRFFPRKHRGVGSTALLGLIDIGNFLGNPLAGGLVTFTGSYAIMFLSVAGVMWAAAASYLWATRPPRATRTVGP